MRLFAGDDWAEDHHDVEVMDEAGKVLAPQAAAGGRGRDRAAARAARRGTSARTRMRRGAGRDRDRPRPVGRGAGRGRLPGVPGEPAAGGPVPGTARGVGSQERRRRRAHAWRTWCAPTPTSCARRPGTAPEAEGVKVLARTHKTMIWERTRGGAAAAAPAAGVLPRRAGGLRGPGRPRRPGTAGQGPRPGQGRAADPRAGQRGAQARQAPRHHRDGPRRSWPRCAASSWPSPPVLTAAYAATVRSLIAVITTLNEQVKTLQEQVEEHFGQHPDAEIILVPAWHGSRSSAPGCSAEFGDDPRRYADGKARRNYAATSPDHPRLGQEESRRRPVRPQRPARRRTQRPGLLRR